ncbi:MAG: UbiD family decarboxylase [Planctomycetia bacterium]|nr:UbiD family decarboxylase [Planctomycetia bacterium]
MSYNSLADFLEELAGRDELVRISAEVDPLLEIAEITRRVAKAGGPALLFDRVRGQTMAVVTNLLGTEHRVCHALGIDSLDEISVRAETLIEKNTPQNWFDRLKMSPEETGANKFRAKTVKNGPSQQVVRLGRDVDLANLPLLKHWPHDSGCSITAGLLLTQDRGDERHLTVRPLQALDHNRLAIIDDGHSGFARHWANHLQAGDKMTAAVILGGDPAAAIAASTELTDGVDAFHMIGLLRGKPVDLVKCRTHAMEVPADADLILEGYLDPEVVPAVVESAGIGGSHYRVPRPAPVLHVTAVTHRSHPIFPALIDSGQHGEIGALIKTRSRLLLAPLRAAVPSLIDLHLPAYGGLDRWAFVSIRKTYPFQARQVASALWGSPVLKYTKFVVVVDEQVNVHDAPSVLAEVGANVAPERDVFPYDGPAHASDHANSMAPLGRHLGIDATAKIAGEQSGAWPAPLATSEEIKQLVTARWGEYKLPLPAGGK